MWCGSVFGISDTRTYLFYVVKDYYDNVNTSDQPLECLCIECQFVLFHF